MLSAKKKKKPDRDTEREN